MVYAQLRSGKSHQSTAGYTYTYDADGNRVKKTNGTTGTLYWYMSPGIVAESDLSGTLKSEYVFFDGERVARRDLVAPGGVLPITSLTISRPRRSSPTRWATSSLNPITTPGAASFSSSPTIPTTTNSPAKNATKPASITSVHGITRMGWRGSSRRIGRPRQQPCRMRSLPIRSR